MQASSPSSESSPLHADQQTATDKQRAEAVWEPGPNLKRPGWLRCKISILGYALRHHFIEIAIMLLALGLLVDLVLRWDELRPPIQDQISMQMVTGMIQDFFHLLVDSPAFFEKEIMASSSSPSTWVSWWINVQSLLGVGTLLVALFVWYNHIREEWTNSLPKRMSVFFLCEGRPAIICRYVWLAGEGDLRAWGQQVASQAVNVSRLLFYPNIKADAPSFAVWIDKKICRHYVVCFDLTSDNAFLFLKEYVGKCHYQNLATGKNDVRPVKLSDLQRKIPASAFPFEWPKDTCESQNQTT
ncbi:MAG: hypothetical protein GYA29_03065 [Methanothrix sp.]|nr:hypothetical protein [Methanothrix sp.]